MTIFNSFLYVYQRVNREKKIIEKYGNNIELDGDVPMFECQRIEVVVTS